MIRFAKVGKTGQKLNALIIINLFILAIFALTGCGGNADIPQASVLSSGRLTLSWVEVPGAASYDLYISTSPGVTTLNSYRISNVSTPLTITDLEPGTAYYFMITVYDDSGGSRNSKEVSYTVDKTEGSIDIGDLSVPDQPLDQSTSAATAPVASPAQDQRTAPKTKAPAPTAAKTKAGPEIIVCFGDSLTAGIGATKGMDYPSQLAGMIGKPIINKGVSGDTTSSALKRLNRDVLSAKPDIVLITLGGNDLKNGVAKNIAFGNLEYIVETIQRQGARVIIGGLKFPGMDRGFGQGYVDLAQQTGAILITDIFAGIVDNPGLMSDPIHPNNAGYRIIAQRFYKALGSAGKTSQSVSKKPVPAATPKAVPATTKKPAPAAAKKSAPVAIPKTAKPATKKTGQAVPSSLAGTRDVTVAWDNVPGATSYNIYWSDKPGVNRRNGTKIGNAKNPHEFKGLLKGKKYYFVVTAVNASGESEESAEFSFTVGQ